MAATQGDLQRERGRYEERLELVRAKGDRRRIAETLNNLAELALATDEIDLAGRTPARPWSWRGTSTKTVTRDVLISLARISLADGPLDAARVPSSRRCSSVLELGQQFEIAQCLLVLAGLAGRTGTTTSAARLYGCAARLRGETSPLDVELEPDIARQRDQVRESSGAEVFAGRQATGAAMSTEEAVALAMTVGLGRRASVRCGSGCSAGC